MAVLVLAGAASLGGCARSAPAKSPGGQAGAGEKGGEVQEGPALVITPDEALTLDQLVTRARAHLDAERYEQAIADYERALATETGAARPDVVLGYAMALDEGGFPDRALRAYQRYVDAHPDASDRTSIEVRIVRLLVHFEEYEVAARLAARIDPKERSTLEAVALYAARGLGRLASGRLEEAERELLRGRTLIDTEGLDRVARPPRDVAALFYGVGELRRLRAEALDFRPLPEDFGARLEERSQLILDAQSAYSQVMKAQSAHWSAMAGVRVGQLYKSLHEDLMAVPLPDAVKTAEDRTLFEGALRFRYSILLDKATKMMEHTLRMLERTGEPSPWRERAEAALDELQKARRREEEILDALPYSRATLQAALEDLDKRAGGDGRLN